MARTVIDLLGFPTQQSREQDHSARPKVSVAIITYNHDQFICQAVNGALSQQTAFEFEILIGEDCSTDRTRELLLAIAAQHPTRIRLLLHDRNLGLQKNFQATYNSCRGEYIALLDGDDFWTDPGKLAMQAQLLDDDPGIALSFHDMAVDGQAGDQQCPAVIPTYAVPERTGLADILRGNYIPSSSVLVRRAAVPVIPDWFGLLAMEDWPLHVLAAQVGWIHHTAAAMAMYRVHPAALWSSRDALYRLREELRAYLVFEQYLSPEFVQIARTRRDEMIDALFQQIRRSEASCSEYANSRSYRLGRLLLAPLRLMSRLADQARGMP